MKIPAQILSEVFGFEPGPDQTLAELMCLHCADGVPVSGAGIAMVTDAGHQSVVGTSNSAAVVLESLQFELGEGPGFDAFRKDRPVLLADLTSGAATRWPAFVPAALDIGIAAVFAFPLHIGAIRLGVLDLYRAEPGSLTPDQLAEALAYADASVLLLLHLQGQVAPGQGLHPEIEAPLERRAEIHQATGVIAVQAVVTLADALLLLRARAYSDGHSMLDIARAVITGALTFKPEIRDDD